MKPGMHPGIPAADYHALRMLSCGTAKTLLQQSPLHAWTASAWNPAYVQEEKQEFDLGSAAHALLIEGEDRMTVIDAKDYRTKLAQELQDAAREQGKHPVLTHQHAAILAMRDEALDAIARCSDLSGLRIEDCQPEATVIWEEDGMLLRCRPDLLTADAVVTLDYKSTTDATPGVFQRQIARMGYHLQDAFYSRGIKAATGIDTRFIFMAQENKPPYKCSFHGCAPSLKQIADGEIDRAIRTWRACLKTNRFPSYPLAIHYAEATAWQMADFEEAENDPRWLSADDLKGGIPA